MSRLKSECKWSKFLDLLQCMTFPMRPLPWNKFHSDPTLVQFAEKTKKKINVASDKSYI